MALMNGFSTNATERDPKFYNEIRQLNEDLLRYVEANHKKSPYFDFTETFLDYIKQMADLEKQYPPGQQPPTEVKTLFSLAHQQPQQPQQPQQLQQPQQPSQPPHQLHPLKQPTQLFQQQQQNSSGPSVNNRTFDDTTRTMDATNTQTATGDDADEDLPPPEPNLAKYEESGAKFQCRCKLYERVVTKGAGATAPAYKGCGVLFVKDMDTPHKLHLIMRQDPDLMRVLLNQVITENIPIKLFPKAVQFLAPSSDGVTRFYVAKVKEDKIGAELFAMLNSVKS